MILAVPQLSREQPFQQAALALDRCVQLAYSLKNVGMCNVSINYTLLNVSAQATPRSKTRVRLLQPAINSIYHADAPQEWVHPMDTMGERYYKIFHATTVSQSESSRRAPPPSQLIILRTPIQRDGVHRRNSDSGCVCPALECSGSWLMITVVPTTTFTKFGTFTSHVGDLPEHNVAAAPCLVVGGTSTQQYFHACNENAQNPRKK